MAQEYDHLVKVVLVGDTQVGKTQVLSRFVGELYSDGYSYTIGVDLKLKTVDAESKKIKFQCWDLGAQERFRTVVRSYFRGAHVVAVVVDATKPKSFEAAEGWIRDAKHVAPNAEFMLVVNKMDLEDKILRDLDERIQALTGEGGLIQGAEVARVSAKTCFGLGDKGEFEQALVEQAEKQIDKGHCPAGAFDRVPRAAHADKPNQPQVKPWYKSGRFWISFAMVVGLTALAVGLTFGLGGGFAAVAGWEIVSKMGLGFVSNLSGPALIAAAIGFASLIYGAASALLVTFGNLVYSGVRWLAKSLTTKLTRPHIVLLGKSNKALLGLANKLGQHQVRDGGELDSRKPSNAYVVRNFQADDQPSFQTAHPAGSDETVERFAKSSDEQDETAEAFITSCIDTRNLSLSEEGCNLADFVPMIVVDPSDEESFRIAKHYIDAILKLKNHSSTFTYQPRFVIVVDNSQGKAGSPDCRRKLESLKEATQQVNTPVVDANSLVESGANGLKQIFADLNQALQPKGYYTYAVSPALVLLGEEKRDRPEGLSNGSGPLLASDLQEEQTGQGDSLGTDASPEAAQQPG